MVADTTHSIDENSDADTSIYPVAKFATDADLDQSLNTPALRWLVGDVSPRSIDAVLRALKELPTSRPEVAEEAEAAGAPADGDRAS